MDTFDKLDKVDLQILRTLQENARLTTKRYKNSIIFYILAIYCSIFLRRLTLQENKDKISVLDAEKLNQGFVVFCSVKLRRLNRDIAAEFTRIIQDIPEVTECYNISEIRDVAIKWSYECAKRS